MLAQDSLTRRYTHFELEAIDRRLGGGRFELQELLNRGATADVYRGTDRYLGRQVAIKLLHPDLVADGAFAVRFEREARAAAALSHPNVVAVFDYGLASMDDLLWLPSRRAATASSLAQRLESQTVPFIVMEYVPGPTLKEIARERAPLPEADALDIGAQIAAALDAAHGQGLMHRNVKPENVLLPASGVVKVTDFGLARALDEAQMTATRTVLGTAHYTSPEQTLGQLVDGRSDLYSLGVVLYELLTGRLPFVAESVVAVAWQHVYDAPIRPRQLRPDLSPATEAVVLRALGKDPAQRFQNAGEMAAALQQARSRPMTYLPPAGTAGGDVMGGDKGARRSAPESTVKGAGGSASQVDSSAPANASAPTVRPSVAPWPDGRGTVSPAPRVGHSGQAARMQTVPPAASLPRLGALLALVMSSLVAGTWLLLRAAGILP